jgi:hypothetical protein
MELIQEIGAYAGLAAFVGLAVLALLYFAQARDVRRLREAASFLVEAPEDAAGPAAPAPAARPVAQPATQARGQAPAPGKKPSDAESFRRAELARQAAERRQRFEHRRRGGPSRIARGGEGRFSSLPEPRALAVILLGAALLAAGVVAVATGALGGKDAVTGSAGQGAIEKETTVAVLNATSTPGLAAEYSRPLKRQGWDVVYTGNTSTPFHKSSVMYEKPGEAAAKQIAPLVKIPKVEPLLDQVRPDAAGAVVIVVLGDDKASGA